MTLYRGMDIGTAKPTLAERADVSHHLIDVIDPWESASVAEFRTWSSVAIQQIEARGNRILFVGGTALYLKTLLRGLFEGPAADSSLRAELEAEADATGDATLHERLAGIDPATAQRLHPNDRRRVIRALEVFLLTGRPLSEHQVEHSNPAPTSVCAIALERPRSELHVRINHRVVQMFEDGLVEEVSRLIRSSRPLHEIPAQGVGYRECVNHLEGKLTLSEAVMQTQARTRQFAKRQATWFRGLTEVQGLAIEGEASVDDVVARLLVRVEKTQRGD